MPLDFCINGVKVYISARKEDQLNQKAEELSEKFGGECIPIHNDLGTLDGVEELVAKYSSFEDSLDFLVNNAGASLGRTFRVFF